jgi:hypothetical protein
MLLFQQSLGLVHPVTLNTVATPTSDVFGYSIAAIESSSSSFKSLLLSLSSCKLLKFINIAHIIYRENVYLAWVRRN